MAKKYYIQRDGVDYIEGNSPNISKNRPTEQYINTAIDIIANYVDKIPYVDVLFQEDMFTLCFNRYSIPSDVMYLRQNVEAEFDQIVAVIDQKLRDASLKSKITLVDIVIDGVAWSTFRTVNYSCKAMYRLERA